MSIVNRVITEITRREFSRAMNFETGETPYVPPPQVSKPRLLYMHIPFCERLCPYCSFNRVAFERSQGVEYCKALRQEILLYRDLGYEFSGIYVGGGTPTVMVDELAEILSLAKTVFPIREISVETNPNHLTDDRLGILKDVGVNRLSVGVQSFDDGLLRKMERFEKYGSGREIADRLSAVQGRFDTLNADMIFNFPTQTPDMLDRDLDILEGLGMDQVTYYPLMVSDSTRRRVARTLGKVSYRTEETFYRQILQRLQRDYRLSSAWCFSRKTSMIDEYIVDYDEYAGLGSGSIGFLSGVCYANTFNIPEYIRQVNAGQLPLMASRTFSLRDLMSYDFLMKLFGTRLDLEVLWDKFGVDPWRYLWFPFWAFRLSGRISYRRPLLQLTPSGCYAWVIMMREFFISVNNFRDFCRETVPFE